MQDRGSRLLGWLGRLLPGRREGAPAAPPAPAVTRAEIAQWFAEAAAGPLAEKLQALRRPGVAVVRCRFEGFQADLQPALEAALHVLAGCDVHASWPADGDADLQRDFAREIIDALNAGRPQVLVLPHERVLARSLPGVDAVVDLPRFDRASLAEACRRFYDLAASPEVPDESWVRLVAPSDLLISSEVRGDPIAAIRDAARRRLREHDCSDAAALPALLGLCEAREWAENLIDDIRDALDPGVRCRWADIERAVVFCGPRGVGRRSLSRAIARSAGLHWVRVSARDWAAAHDAERWQSHGEPPLSLQSMQADFDKARELAPAMLFVSELGAMSAELAQMFGRLVAEVGDEHPVIVVGSETAGKLPDDEVLRMARFEHTVHLPLPKTATLAAALRERLGPIDHALSQAQVGQAARLILGETAADVDRHIRRAQRIARRAGRQVLQFDDWAAAVLERPDASARPGIDEAELAVTAHHEAGHAVMQFLDEDCGTELQYMTIVPRLRGDSATLGFVLFGQEQERFSRSRAEGFAALRIALGGRAAEEILLGPDRLTTGSGGSESSDLAKATRLATHLIGRCGMGTRGSLLYRPAGVHEDPRLARQVDALLKREYRATLGMLRRNWAMVVALSQRLIEDQELSGDEVRVLLAEVREKVRLRAGPRVRRVAAPQRATCEA